MAEDTASRVATPATSSGLGSEVYMGLLWLGISVWVAHATLTGNGAPSALGSAIAALPGVIATTMLTSATIAKAAASRFRPAIGRLLAGLAVGVIFGAIATVGIRFAYGDHPSIMVFALTVGAASVAGGVLAVLPPAVLEAALWASTFVFLFGVVFGVLQLQGTTLLGGGPKADPAAQAAANTQFFYLQAVFTALIAGIYSFRNLRSEDPAKLWYGVAGAVPGLILLASELLTRLGGTAVVELVNGLSDGKALAGLADEGRMRLALIVLALGGFVALLRAAFVRRDADADD